MINPKINEVKEYLLLYILEFSIKSLSSLDELL